MDWDGGCWWALTDGASALEPGKAMLVGTGIEDFFNSGFAFGFFGKTFHNDLSGLSHVHGSTGHGLVSPRPDWFSAYRYFVRRPRSHSRSHPFSRQLLCPVALRLSLPASCALPSEIWTCSHVACGAGSGPADVLGRPAGVCLAERRVAQGPDLPPARPRHGPRQPYDRRFLRLGLHMGRAAVSRLDR